jgi:hypothetical protein
MLEESAPASRASCCMEMRRSLLWRIRWTSFLEAEDVGEVSGDLVIDWGEDLVIDWRVGIECGV